MNIIEYPEREQWAEITRRPHIDTTLLYDTVNEVLSDIRANGDSAVMKYEERFDHARLSGLKVSEEEIKEAHDNTPKELVDAIRLAISGSSIRHKRFPVSTPRHSPE